MDSRRCVESDARRAQTAGPSRRAGRVVARRDRSRRAASRRAGARLGRPVADRAGARLPRLGRPSRQRAVPARAIGRVGGRQGGALRRRDHGRDGDRAAAGRPSLSGSGLEPAAVQSLRPGVSSRRGMVGRGGDRPAGNQRRRSARRRVRHTPMDRHVFALERPVAQSGGHPRDPADGRRQFPPGGGELRRRRPIGVRRRGRRRGVPRRARPRRHSRRGGAAQRFDRTDPIRADDAGGRARAGADRSRLDHEILHPRPEARGFPDPLSRRPGTHGVRDFLAQSDRRIS